MGWGVGVPAVFRASQVNSGACHLGQVGVACEKVKYPTLSAF